MWVTIPPQSKILGSNGEATPPPPYRNFCGWDSHINRGTPPPIMGGSINPCVLTPEVAGIGDEAHREESARDRERERELF